MTKYLILGIGVLVVEIVPVRVVDMVPAVVVEIVPVFVVEMVPVFVVEIVPVFERPVNDAVIINSAAHAMDLKLFIDISCGNKVMVSDPLALPLLVGPN